MSGMIGSQADFRQKE